MSNTRKMTYIAIVDDKKSILAALEARLAATGDIAVLFTAENGKEFLEKMAESRRTVEPDVVLMDIDMPVMDGIETVEKLKERYPQSKILMLTIFDEDDKIFRAIKAGASGYLLKDEPVEKIKEAIFSLRDNEGAPMSPSIARRALNLLMRAQMDVAEVNRENDLNQYQLSEREKEILLLLVDGLEYKEIAITTGLSPYTVRNHVSNVYRKLHITSKTQAIKMFSKKK